MSITSTWNKEPVRSLKYAIYKWSELKLAEWLKQHFNSTSLSVNRRRSWLSRWVEVQIYFTDSRGVSVSTSNRFCGVFRKYLGLLCVLQKFQATDNSKLLHHLASVDRSADFSFFPAIFGWIFNSRQVALQWLDLPTTRLLCLRFQHRVFAYNGANGV